MMLSPAVCRSQRILERLPDGSIRVEIEGKQYLAITRAQLDGWQILQNNYDSLLLDLKDQKRLTEVAEAKRNEAIAQKGLEAQRAASFERDFNRAQEDAKRNYGLFIGERTLRQQQDQFIPHGEAGGFGGKVLKFLDSGYGQSLFKLVIPTAQAVKVFTARCQP